MNKPLVVDGVNVSSFVQLLDDALCDLRTETPQQRPARSAPLSIEEIRQRRAVHPSFDGRTPASREAQRQELEAHIDAFLRGGNHIQPVPQGATGFHGGRCGICVDGTRHTAVTRRGRAAYLRAAK